MLPKPSSSTAALPVLILLLLAAPLLLLPQGLAAQTGESVGSVTGLPVPRYVTLRTDKVNLRTGPGVRYPVDWVFVRENMPVEIASEFGNWRKIRDFEGTEGWVHQSMLSGRRTVLVIGDKQTLRREAADNAPAVAHMEPGVIARLDACTGEWCEIEVSGLGGWIRRAAIWGVHANEAPR